MRQSLLGRGASLARVLVDGDADDPHARHERCRSQPKLGIELIGRGRPGDKGKDGGADQVAGGTRTPADVGVSRASAVGGMQEKKN